MDKRLPVTITAQLQTESTDLESHIKEAELAFIILLYSFSVTTIKSRWSKPSYSLSLFLTSLARSFNDFRAEPPITRKAYLSELRQVSQHCFLRPLSAHFCRYDGHEHNVYTREIFTNYRHWWHGPYII